ncbi:MAG: TetR/AcrR family transcriptional regulator [Actinomycetota bacterium]|nr:TetR/AcrR family transcriptional regulator [Actinomycetota bacterium]
MSPERTANPATRAATKVTRRPRGAPRLLLLEAARDLFSRQDYRSTTTREIAEAAGVAEHLLFRNFGSKAALFREALVIPFMEFVDGFRDTWRSLDLSSANEDEVAGQFLGALYDLFVENRGLVMTLWAADALTDEERDETGMADIDRALATLSLIGTEGIDALGMPRNHDLVARSTVAMVAGMAAFGATFFGGKRPPREAIVNELVQATLHGFLHRSG